MIDEEDIPQAVLEYALTRYQERLPELADRHGEEFPEKNWDLDDDDWTKNFLCWLLFEKVLPEGNRTIAEEFAEQTTELTPEVKQNVLQMRHMVRSKFIVLSQQRDMVQLKDMNSRIVYNVKRSPREVQLQLDTVIIGRIHPFGDHYRTSGFLLYEATPLILDGGILFRAYEDCQVQRFEDIQLYHNSTFQSVLNKYPCHWVDSICEIYSLKRRVKKEKIKAIEDTILSDLPRIVQELPEKSADVLRLCLKNGGYAKYGKLKDYDDEIRFFWGRETRMSTVGELRRRGLLFVGRMAFGGRNFKVAFVPNEFQEGLKKLL